MSEIKSSTGFSKTAKPAGSSKPSGKTPATSGQQVDLAQLFGAVASALAKNRQSLNRADTFNHDHGDNIVQIFELVTQVIQQNQGAAPAAQLAQASKALASAPSGSAQLYAGGLAQAAQQLQGQKQLTAESALPLVMALLGGGQTQPQEGAGDLLGSLLGGGQSQPGGAGDLLGALLGVGGSQETASAGSGPAGADLLSALLGSPDAQGQRQVDTAQLLNAGLNIGMAYLSAKQKGSSTGEALIGALLKSSPMGQSPHRAKSGALVADTILTVLGSLAQQK